MLYFIKFIYSTFLLPPGFIILAFALLSITFYKKHSRVSLCFIAITILFYLSSISLIGNFLLRPLENQFQPPKRIIGDVIIMLGDGATLDTPNLNGKGHLSSIAANRLLTCIQLYHKLNAPIVVSGGQVFKNTGREAQIGNNILLDLGIPKDKIFIEDESLNTTENAKYVKKILNQQHFRKPILVTSAFHMPRAVRQFQKAGITVTPFPADYHTNISFRFSSRQLVPTSEAMNDVSIALKEYLGLIFIKWH